MAKKENIFKRIWNRLGQTDVEVTEADVDRILEAEGNLELIDKSGKNKKSVVEKVNTKPVRMEDIIPEQSKSNLEREDRE